MTVNALDNGYTDRSPCLDDCPYANDDKKDCIDRCGRLEAYRNGQPYKHIPRLVKGEPAPAKTTKKVAVVPVKKEVKEVSGADRLEAALEKTGGKCLICKDRKAIRRGLCIRCYCRWRHGLELHPIFGIFRVMTLDELSASRHERYVDCLMPNCTGLGERRKLCSKCYKLWIRNKIEHPIEGRFEPKNKKSYKQQKEVVVTETEQRKIVIDLTGYDKLFDRLKQEADKGFVPIAHVVISLVSAELEKK